MSDEPTFSEEHTASLQDVVQLYLDGKLRRFEAMLELHTLAKSICTELGITYSSDTVLQPYVVQIDRHAELQRTGGGSSGGGENPGPEGNGLDGNGGGSPGPSKRLRDDPDATVSGRCFYHRRPTSAHPAASDPEVQDRLVDACEELTGVAFPGG